MLNSEERRYLAQALRDRARAAERDYHACANHSRKLIGHSRQLGWDNPDGAYAFYSAVRSERAALEKYRRALAVFTDFLLYQKIPPARNLLDPLLSQAIKASGADMGTLQIFEPAEGVLRIEAQSGFQRPFLDFFAAVGGETESACGAALSAGAPVVVDDVRTSPIFQGTAALPIMLEARALAVRSVPLISPAGDLVGMVSTHYRKPARPGEHDPKLLAPAAAEMAALIAAAR